MQLIWEVTDKKRWLGQGRHIFWEKNMFGLIIRIIAQVKPTANQIKEAPLDV